MNICKGSAANNRKTDRTRALNISGNRSTTGNMAFAQWRNDYWIIKKSRRTDSIMPKRIIFIFGLLVPLVAIYGAFAENFKVIQAEYFWHSSNLTNIQAPATQKISVPIDNEKPALGALAYDRYFEQHGTPPPLEFLQPLKRDSDNLARLSGEQIIFNKLGIKKPLKKDIAPAGAERATPYLLAIPDSNRVLVVYPYYFYGCKDNDHMVEVYSEHGSLLHTFDSLPTHALKAYSDVLIAPEKSGCCDSLKWHIRFYNLRTGIVSDFRCPEGYCGDVLFTRLGQEGPLMVGQEITGLVEGIGAALQTNIFIVDTDGSLLASGKILHVLRHPSVHKRNIQDISPYSISKLVSLVSAEVDNAWYLQFVDNNRQRILKLENTSQDLTPAIVFLIPKDADAKATIKLNNQKLGVLPILAISDPGAFTLSRNDSKYASRILIQADTINKIIF